MTHEHRIIYFALSAHICFCTLACVYVINRLKNAKTVRDMVFKDAIEKDILYLKSTLERSGKPITESKLENTFVIMLFLVNFFTFVYVQTLYKKIVSIFKSKNE